LARRALQEKPTRPDLEILTKDLGSNYSAYSQHLQESTSDFIHKGKETIKKHLNKKFWGVQNPFFKKGFGRRRQRRCFFFLQHIDASFDACCIKMVQIF
jgi:hypothetical protein